MQNPDRDYHIIAARKAVKEAQEALASRPGPTEALEVQHLKQKWEAMKTISLVRPIHE